jgi:5,5'-dehydrodivanillate O-demethylase oxygenase subunit
MELADYTDFVHTGPGTLAGRYLRTFWQPIYRAEDLAPGQAVPVEIMSERLTLYRGLTGAAHLVGFRCAHRGTQLSTGWVEDDCVRCLYHGWKYDGSGQCVEQPGEDESFKAKVRIAAYPTREYLGLIFAYLGVGEPAPFKRYLDFEGDGVLELGLPEIWPCNYFNRVDNACDIGHVSFTHRESTTRAGKGDQYAIPTLESEETEYGIRTARLVPGRPPLYFHFHMPNVNQVRSLSRVEGSAQDAASMWLDELFFRVPINDESCVTFVVDFKHLTSAEAEAYRERRRQTQETIPVSPNDVAEAVLAARMRMPAVDRRLSMPKLFWIEDYIAQVGQGPVADRSHERLGRMDAGVILLRKIWQRELRALAEGQPLKQWASPAGLAKMSMAAVR